MVGMDIKNAKITFVILTFHQRSKTVRCLESLRLIKSPEFNVVLWDNGSTDGTTEYVQEHFPEVLVHHHPENLGWSDGRNEGAKLAIEKFGATHLLFMDNDAVITSEISLVPMLAPFMTNEKLAQTSAKIRFLSGEQRIYDAGGSIIRYWLASTNPVGNGEIDRGQYEVPTRCIPPTGCMMVRTDVFNEVGGFDPLFFPLGFEDLDFSLRVAKAGYYALYVPDFVIFHDPGKTVGEGSYTKKYAHYKVQGWLNFMNRHAPFHQKLAFYLMGIPVGVVRGVIREGMRGNLGAILGWFPGFRRRSKGAAN